jgi:hypothetical protein
MVTMMKLLKSINLAGGVITVGLIYALLIWFVGALGGVMLEALTGS